MSPEQHPSSRESGSSPELERRDEPRIYVACLAAYNEGYLHGRWCDAGRILDDLQDEIRQMLAESPVPGAEEYAIHDYDGFGPLHLGEYESIEKVNRIAEGIVEHGMAYAHWLSYAGTDEGQLEAFEDHYSGHWPSVTEYAGQLLDDLGIGQALEQIDDSFRPYVHVDVDAFARDLAADHYISEGDGGVHIFLAG